MIQVVPPVGFVDVALKVTDPLLDLAPGSLVENRIAMPAVLRTIRKLEAMDFPARTGEEPSQVMKTFWFVSCTARPSNAMFQIDG